VENGPFLSFGFERLPKRFDDVALLHLDNVVAEVVRVQVARATVGVDGNRDFEFDISL
jgi:hypothetical protein